MGASPKFVPPGPIFGRIPVSVKRVRASIFSAGRIGPIETPNFRIGRTPRLEARPACPPFATFAVAICDSRFTSFATFNRPRRTSAIRPSLAKPLSIGTRVWYHDTAQVAGEA
jgi:hypothetical protein